MSETKEPFLQFPLGALAVKSTDWKDSLQHILSFCLVRVGDGIEDVDNESAKIERAASVLHVKLNGSLGRIRDQARAVRMLGYGYGTDAEVRIAHRIFWACHNDGAPTWNEFRVLCGIYSAIGNKPFARCSIDSLRMRSAGCRKAALYSPKTHLPLLGEKEVRLCVDRLWLGGFFARFTYRRRLTFYSHRLTADALRQQVVALCVQSQEKIAAARKADAAFSFSVRANSCEPEANQGRT